MITHRILAGVLAAVMIASVVPGPVPAQGQTLLTDLSLLRCVSLGTRIDVINQMDVNRERTSQTLDLLEDVREEMVELNAEYRNIYDRLQTAFQNGSSSVEDLAEELGELEGERLAVILQFELKLRELIGSAKYGDYRDRLQSELVDRINQRHLAMLDRGDTRWHIPRIRLDKHTVNFCPALPQE